MPAKLARTPLRCGARFKGVMFTKHLKSMTNTIVVLLMTMFSCTSFAMECIESIEVENLLQLSVIETGKSHTVTFSAPTKHQGNTLLGFRIYFKKTDDGKSGYDGYISIKRVSKDNLSSAVLKFNNDKGFENLFPEHHSALLKVEYKPSWQNEETSTLEECISITQILDLKHNKFKNEFASKAGTDAAKTRRPF